MPSADAHHLPDLALLQSYSKSECTENTACNLSLDKSEKFIRLFAAELLARLGGKVMVPWPVLIEADLSLGSRDFPSSAMVFGESMATGFDRLDSPTAADLESALKLRKRYGDCKADLPFLIIMPKAHPRKAQILTWDFSHFRSVVLKRGHHWPLPVSKTEMLLSLSEYLDPPTGRYSIVIL